MNSQTTTFYNKFSSFYPLVDFFMKGQKKLLFEEINTLPEGRLLEIGVGNGSHLRRYKKHKIIGIDTSASMLDIARKNAFPHIELAQMDGQNLLYPGAFFDYAVLSHVVAVVDDPEQLIEQVLRVLKPGGKIFILNHVTPDNWMRHFDKVFSVAAKTLHFRSVFHIHDIVALKKCRLLKETSLGTLSYFKLLAYQKPELQK